MATISMLSKTRAKVAEFGDKLFTLKMLGGNKEFARLQTLLKNGEIEFVRSEITKHTNSRGSTEVNLYRSTNFVVQPEKMEKYVGVSNMDAWKQIYSAKGKTLNAGLGVFSRRREMWFFKSKNSEKIAELETKIGKLERELERVSSIRIGEIDWRCFWIDHRPKISIGEAVSLLIKQQGLELMHTAASEKTELVKTKKGRA